MIEKKLICFDDEALASLDALRDKLGRGDSEIVRGSLLAWSTGNFRIVRHTIATHLQTLTALESFYRQALPDDSEYHDMMRKAIESIRSTVAAPIAKPAAELAGAGV